MAQTACGQALRQRPCSGAAAALFHHPPLLHAVWQLLGARNRHLKARPKTRRSLGKRRRCGPLAAAAQQRGATPGWRRRKTRTTSGGCARSRNLQGSLFGPRWCTIADPGRPCRLCLGIVPIPSRPRPARQRLCRQFSAHDSRRCSLQQHLALGLTPHSAASRHGGATRQSRVYQSRPLGVLIHARMALPRNAPPLPLVSLSQWFSLVLCSSTLPPVPKKTLRKAQQPDAAGRVLGCSQARVFPSSASRSAFCSCHACVGVSSVCDVERYLIAGPSDCAALCKQAV